MPQPIARLETVRRLSLADRAQVAGLLVAAAAEDGVTPLNEAATFALDHDAVHVIARDVTDPTHVLGYAAVDPETTTAQLVVAPDARGRGTGSTLVRSVIDAYPNAAFWAFGDLPAARRLAARFGLRPDRTLLQMERDVLAHPPADRQPPADITVRGFRPGDEESLLAVNAAAFAHHPEQGSLTRADLDERLASDWFDPAGLILATADDRLLGFHWTKVHSATQGEVYVLAVAPDASGRGLGRVLLEAGLAHLARGGAEHVILYVEGDNDRVVRLYTNADFATVHTDVRYGRQAAPAQEDT